MLKVFNITRNHLDEDNDARNWWNVPLNWRPTKLPVAFRLCNADDAVYFSGRATCEHGALAALDFVADCYDCTIVQTRVAGRWKALN